MNYFKTFLLMAGLTLLFYFVGQLIGGPRYAMYGLIFAAVLNVGTYWFSDRMVIAMHGAVPVGPREAPGLWRAVEKLALAGDMPCPKVYVFDADQPNAFATGRSLKHSAVAASRGLVEMLSQAELEGVVAHELAHIKHRDMLISTVAAVMAGAIMMIADQLRWAAMFGGFGGRDDRREGANPLGLILVMVLAPFAAMLIQLAISRSREFAADEGAAALTGDPDALSRALKKIHAAADRIPLEQASTATAHLYIANPFGGEGFVVNLFRTHPALGRRLKRLEQISSGRIRPVL